MHQHRYIMISMVSLPFNLSSVVLLSVAMLILVGIVYNTLLAEIFVSTNFRESPSKHAKKNFCGF